jgi:hypothetical protein
VGLGVTGASGGELRLRPISRTTTIPTTEHPPRKMGMKRLRSKPGWLSMRLVSFSQDQMIAPEKELKS